MERSTITNLETMHNFEVIFDKYNAYGRRTLVVRPSKNKTEIIIIIIIIIIDYKS